MKDEQIRDLLISAGVKNLVAFGYTNADRENILTDMVYSEMFKNMLVENKGAGSKQVDVVIDVLINEISQNTQ